MCISPINELICISDSKPILYNRGELNITKLMEIIKVENANCNRNGRIEMMSLTIYDIIRFNRTFSNFFSFRTFLMNVYLVNKLLKTE